MPSASAWRAALAAIVLLIAWRVAAVNLLAYNAEGRPRIAPQGATRADDSGLALEALRRNPGETVALLALAQWHEGNARAEAARKAYEAALTLAPLDRELLALTSVFFLKSGEIVRGLALLDRMAANYPYTHDRVFPVLGQILASHRDAATWRALAERNPPWIGKFIAAACSYRGLDPGILTPLLARGAKSVARPEAACVVERLRQAERWEEAYQVWLNSLAPERLGDVGFVFNGGFEFAPSGYGFDWRLARPEHDQGNTADIRTVGASGRRALRVSYSGKRQVGTPASQFLALTPGQYRLEGQAHAEALTSIRGANWTVRCAGADGAVLGRSEVFMGTSEWRRFEFAFTVPAGCRGQALQLEAVGIGEGVVFLSGVAWFDDIAARRVR